MALRCTKHVLRRSQALNGALRLSSTSQNHVDVPTAALMASAGLQRRSYSGIPVASAVAEAAATEAAASPGLVGGLLETLQATSGLPWWATLVATTLTVRTVLSPLNVQMMKTSAMLQKIKPQTEKMQQEIRALASAGDMDGARAKQLEVKKFMESEGANPLKALLGPVIQLPVFLSMFFGIRQLAQTNTDLHEGGLAWFTDLTVADPTYILPVFCSATMLAVLELGAETGGANSIQNSNPMVRNFMRGMCAISVPVTASFPAALFCYWIPNNVFSLALALVMRSGPMQRYIGVQVASKKEPTSVVAPITPADAAASYSRSTTTQIESAKDTPPRPAALLQQKPRGRNSRTRRGLQILAAHQIFKQQRSGVAGR